MMLTAPSVTELSESTKSSMSYRKMRPTVKAGYTGVIYTGLTKTVQGLFVCEQGFIYRNSLYTGFFSVPPIQNFLIRYNQL